MSENRRVIMEVASTSSLCNMHTKSGDGVFEVFSMAKVDETVIHEWLDNSMLVDHFVQMAQQLHQGKDGHQERMRLHWIEKIWAKDDDERFPQSKVPRSIWVRGNAKGSESFFREQFQSAYVGMTTHSALQYLEQIPPQTNTTLRIACVALSMSVE